MARLVEMITITDGPRENLLSWRILGSLQQIFGLEVLWPANCLTADVHYPIWKRDDTQPPDGFRSALVDLTRFSRQEIARLVKEGLIPTANTVVVTEGDDFGRDRGWVASNSFKKVFSCLETETCFYQPGWW